MTKHLMRAALAGAPACALCVGATTKASADEWNHKTIVTLNETMKVPHATLPPGRYIFQLADDNGSRGVVNIRRASDNELVATADTIPFRRNNDYNRLALEVAMPASNSVPLLKGWMYPGFGGGHEFVYPRAERREMARAETVEIPVAPRG